MKIVCDACSAKYSIADEKVRGKVFKIRCKKCSNIIVVRGAVSEAAEPAAPKFDQTATKVHDYAGYDGQRPTDEVSEAPPGAIWHLVIDQEQVGPMTVEEVRERLQRGEIDADGYVWREGFADWERLSDVDAFAALVSGGGARADNGGVGVLFGSGGADVYDDGRAGQNDPTDLFAARGAADDAGAAADLFSGSGMGMGMGMGSADPGGGDADALFAGSDGGGLGAAVSRPAASSLTGQRNENSVLFSLNNLAALASDAPRAAPLSASSSSASLASGSSAGAAPATASEGSGLIDIRSMAQVYLGESKTSSRPVGSADDLPVFSQTSFESASPVLLPSVQPAVNNKLLIALVGLIGVLVIAAVILVVIVLKGNGGERPKVASAETAKPGEQARPAGASGSGSPAAGAADPGTPSAGAAGAGAGGSSSGAAPPAGDSAGGSSAGAAAEPPPPASGSAAQPDPGSGDKTSASARDRAKDKRDKDKDRRDRHSDRRLDSASARDKHAERKPEPPPPQPPPAATSTSGCDEVSCLVEPDKPCCKKYGRRSGGSSGSGSDSVDPSLPERPSRGDVASGIGDVKGSVSACGSRAPGGGRVTVKIKISPSGTVASATATGGSASLNGCVESAVKRARFPKSQLGASVNYPFIF